MIHVTFHMMAFYCCLCLGLTACGASDGGGQKYPPEETKADGLEQDTTDPVDGRTPWDSHQSNGDTVTTDVLISDGLPELPKEDGLVPELRSDGREDGLGEDQSGGECPNGVCPVVAKACVLACSTAADCVYEGTQPGGIYDQDNWACQEGRCRYSGCNSDAECAAQPGLEYATFRCVGTAGGLKSCLVECETSLDCPHPSRTAYPLYGADNYECLNGVCSYTGCNSDQECIEGMAGTGLQWLCFDQAGGFPMCASPCQQAADCVYVAENVLFDADNYTCQQGMCQFSGCNSDQECSLAYAYSGLTYVCAEP